MPLWRAIQNVLDLRGLDHLVGLHALRCGVGGPPAILTNVAYLYVSIWMLRSETVQGDSGLNHLDSGHITPVNCSALLGPNPIPHSTNSMIIYGVPIQRCLD
ncbi:hypothetical protein L917_13014 [Phytophthora nicotianae]|nr:hypothetical protein L917_13014 [Phytophthora nicotianae]